MTQNPVPPARSVTHPWDYCHRHTAVLTGALVALFGVGALLVTPLPIHSCCKYLNLDQDFIATKQPLIAIAASYSGWSLDICSKFPWQLCGLATWYTTNPSTEHITMLLCYLMSLDLKQCMRYAAIWKQYGTSPSLFSCLLLIQIAANSQFYFRERGSYLPRAAL